jgi:hypothetical protein
MPPAPSNGLTGRHYRRSEGVAITGGTGCGVAYGAVLPHVCPTGMGNCPAGPVVRQAKTATEQVTVLGRRAWQDAAVNLTVVVNGVDTYDGLGLLVDRLVRPTPVRQTRLIGPAGAVCLRDLPPELA